MFLVFCFDPNTPGRRRHKLPGSNSAVPLPDSLSGLQTDPVPLVVVSPVHHSFSAQLRPALPLYLPPLPHQPFPALLHTPPYPKPNHHPPPHPRPGPADPLLAAVGNRLRLRRRGSQDLRTRGLRQRRALLARVGPRLQGPRVGAGAEHARRPGVPGCRVVGGRIYVIGGCLVDTWARSRNWAEVFDPKTGSWNAVSSQIEIREKWMHASAVIDDTVYAMADRGGVKYDPKNLSWESVENEVDMGWRGRGCVVDGVLYCYDYLGKIRGFDKNRGEWTELRGVEGLPRFLCGATMTSLGGKLVVVWEENGGSRKEMGIRCAEIAVERGGDGELWGKIVWSDVVLSVPKGSSIVHCMAVTL
ncbi:hypothetical protein JRO89_XS08G0033400 [Xanthoceras sorbifolium]|uniref:FKB95-like N-terminal Kelch domain-containing protein n=1 Tax=Xanthoceras sorbifolium TaxID=99658 RepID=A0ABQ8HNI4_9ROSI|nr:hypothetical protein JRO89_XS08G0033400 [Xanthoceras sorbifolium]